MLKNIIYNLIEGIVDAVIIVFILFWLIKFIIYIKKKYELYKSSKKSSNR